MCCCGQQDIHYSAFLRAVTAREQNGDCLNFPLFDNNFLPNRAEIIDLAPKSCCLRSEFLEFWCFQGYSCMMIRRQELRISSRMMILCIGLILIPTGLVHSSESEIRMHSGGSVTGTILAEKEDQLVVDLGYTVLVIPRERIESIQRGDKQPTITSPKPSEKLSENGSLYFSYKSPPAEIDMKSIVQKVGQAVVQVRTPGGLGSGFFINKDGHLVTNYHVIEKENELQVEVYHIEKKRLVRRTYRDIRIIAMNKFDDLALLKVDAPDNGEFEAVPLGDIDRLEAGESVFAIGSPLGLERTVTQGILSTKNRLIQGNLYLQTNTQINPGNSGGPLFNRSGEVVGVNNMKLTSGEGLGFAIPVSRVKYFLKNQDAFAYNLSNPVSPFVYGDPPRRPRAN